MLLDFLGTSRILPRRAFIKALSLEAAVLSLVHTSGPEEGRDGQPHSIALPSRLFSKRRIAAALTELFRGGERGRLGWRVQPELQAVQSSVQAVGPPSSLLQLS